MKAELVLSFVIITVSIIIAKEEPLLAFCGILNAIVYLITTKIKMNRKEKHHEK